MKKIASRKPAAAKPTVRVLLGDAIAMGPGKADLLEAVDRLGSISAAARAMGMSYRRAWLLIDTMNQCFKSPLVHTAVGGGGGGGAQVTDLGREVLQRYRSMQAKAQASIERDMASFARSMARGKS